MSFPQLQQPAVGPTVALARPQPRRIALTVFDPDLLAEAARGAGLEHRQLYRGPFRGQLVRAGVEGLVIDGGHYSQTLLVRGGFSPTRITIGIPLSDREPGFINGIRARAHDLAVFPEDGEIEYVLPAATEWGAVQVERDALAAVGVPEESFGRMSVISPQDGQHGRRSKTAR